MILLIQGEMTNFATLKFKKAVLQKTPQKSKKVSHNLGKAVLTHVVSIKGEYSSHLKNIYKSHTKKDDPLEKKDQKR